MNNYVLFNLHFKLFSLTYLYKLSPTGCHDCPAQEFDIFVQCSLIVCDGQGNIIYT